MTTKTAISYYIVYQPVARAPLGVRERSLEVREHN
jgi:hypothetical protein